jgi:hypothetical protein
MTHFRLQFRFFVDGHKTFEGNVSTSEYEDGIPYNIACYRLLKGLAQTLVQVDQPKLGGKTEILVSQDAKAHNTKVHHKLFVPEGEKSS